MKKIIVVGGGFAGMNFAKKLGENSNYEIILIDQNNYNFFSPLLYQVATAFIEPSNITYPFRRMFNRRSNLKFVMGELISIKPELNLVETDKGNFAYDYIVLAMGTETNYFGLENIKLNAWPMKSVVDSLMLKNHILLNLENASRNGICPDGEKIKNIVIAGGGPSGVEIAGMLAEMKKNLLKKDYPEIKSIVINIYLIDAGTKLLGAMSRKSSAFALGTLKELGVNILLNTNVKDYVNNEVILGDGSTIHSSTLIWASGVIAKAVPGLPATVVTKGRRIMVNELNRVQGFENIYAIGDISFQTSDPKYPNAYPQLAQVALQQGNSLAVNFKRLLKNHPLKPFRYFNKGSLAIISKYKAVADLPGLSFCGFFAWLLWLFAHVIPLAGFRNKMKLSMSWCWNFITNSPTSGMILRIGSKQ